MKETISEKKISIYFLIPLFLLLLSLFFLISSFIDKSSSKTDNSLYIISNELDIINNNLVKKLDSNFEDIDSLIPVFTESLTSLNKTLEIVKDHYNDNIAYKNMIISSISSNIYFYDNCLETLNNRDDINSSYELNKFHSLKNSCINNYELLLETFNLDFSFVSNMEKTFDEYYISLNKLIKENRDNEFKLKQEEEFIMNLKNLNKSLPSLNQDLIPAILRIRDENRDLSVILDDIQIKEDNFYKIKNTIVSTSLPEGSLEYYTLFSEYLNLYEIYLSSIKEAVVFEYSLDNYSENSKAINRRYKNSSSKREDVINSYNSYISTFSN